LAVVVGGGLLQRLDMIVFGIIHQSTQPGEFGGYILKHDKTSQANHEPDLILRLEL